MKSTKAASRYATALLELAIEQQKLDAVEKDMLHLLETAEETHDFQVFLNSPVIKVDKKISILKELFGQFDGLTTSFLTLIAKNGRESMMVEIASSYIDLLKAHRGIVPVTIVSASTLSNEAKSSILSKVAGYVNGQPEITEKVNPDLIGGFVVKIGDKQIDASVATQLGRIRQALVN
ncbi:MAG: hypothetical protein RL264_2337 [Bacteroidota bacterium]|jgi:F-type H+-transporting ATPase subunit delta